MDPIAKTAYYCCGVRMLDAHAQSPVCGDHYAELFMDAEAREIFRRFEKFRGPNLANAARHRIIDDILRERLARHPDMHVLLLGAGFDTRAFRLAGGQWFEIDTPALIARKESILPAHTAPNPLARIAMDFSSDRLEHKLAALAAPAAPAVVVMEGVSMYLSPDQLRDTLNLLRRLFPGHTLVCDLMTDAFAQRFGRGLRRRIRELGGNFAPLLDDPASFVAAAHYREAARHSIAGRAVAHGSLPLPLWLFNSLLKSLRDGYQLHVFEANSI
ncbi:MAG: class I SAM-dependent methyltransferase [Rhodocyclaceae bacterium]|nr:class I SAM-dependent methyltransferase [Rhodocyclaceae bacterium]